MHAIGCSLKQAWGPLADHGEPPASAGLAKRTRAHQLPAPAPQAASDPDPDLDLEPTVEPRPEPEPRRPVARAASRTSPASRADAEYELRRLALFTAMGAGALYLMDLSVRRARA